MTEQNNIVIETIMGLRSIRKFSEKEISDNNLKIILNSCVRAANASGRQSYSIIVVDDKELLKQLFYGANKGLLFCVDYNRIIDTANYLGHSFTVDSSQAFITGSTDTILTAQTALIAAKSLGIDSLLTNSIHRAPSEKIYEIFNLPKKYCFPLVALCLGYTEEEPPYKKGRLANSGVIHFGKYSKLTKEELEKVVNEYDDQEKHIANRTKEQLAELGFERYLDWFYKVWSTRFANVEKENMQEVLKRVGFLS
ncbi:MAG: nitroreductase [Candidatus Heimdallarchaeota archaeon]|nr:nitroreductase [Candidatus Heimdallarchaeota archaeon]